MPNIINFPPASLKMDNEKAKVQHLLIKVNIKVEEKSIPTYISENLLE